jgi:histidine kinase
MVVASVIAAQYLINMPLDARSVILHVDDELPVRQALAMLLRSENHEVRSAGTAAQALGWIADGLRPDILIVDFNLGEELNGAELSEELRRALGYAPPVVMLTGDPSSAEIPWITEAPVWLAHKSANPQILLAAIPGLTQLSRSVRKFMNTPR